MKNNTLVVCSGGLDSTVLAYDTYRTGKLGGLITFDYGQRHSKEIGFAANTALKLGVLHKIVDLKGVLSQGSALTDPNVAVPEGHYAAESMHQTVVPNRNAMMLSIAAAVAGSLGMSEIATAIHAGDHPIYADCRPEFLDTFNEMLAASFANHPLPMKLRAPYVHWPKDRIVLLGAQIGVPFEDTWTCYNGREKPCGRCGTCVERLEAFAIHGLRDPHTYEDADYWKTVVK